MENWRRWCQSIFTPSPVSIAPKGHLGLVLGSFSDCFQETDLRSRLQLLKEKGLDMDATDVEGQGLAHFAADASALDACAQFAASFNAEYSPKWLVDIHPRLNDVHQRVSSLKNNDTQLLQSSKLGFGPSLEGIWATASKIRVSDQSTQSMGSTDPSPRKRRIMLSNLLLQAMVTSLQQSRIKQSSNHPPIM